MSRPNELFLQADTLLIAGRTLRAEDKETVVGLDPFEKELRGFGS